MVDPFVRKLKVFAMRSTDFSLGLTFKKLIVLFLVVVMTHCAPGGDMGILGSVLSGSSSSGSGSVSGSGSTGSGGISISPTGNKASDGSDPGHLGGTDSGMDSGSDSIDAGGTENAPSAFIPLPSLEKSIISNPDNQGTVAFQSQSGSFDAGYGVAVRNKTQFAVWQKDQKTLWARVSRGVQGWVSGLYNTVMGTAVADDDGSCFDGDPHTTLLTVETDGSVLPQAITGHREGDQYEVFYYDLESCVAGDSAEDQPNPNVLYVAQKPASGEALTKDGGMGFHQLDGDGNVMQFTFDTGLQKFTVEGEFASGYVQFSVGDEFEQLSFNEVNGEFVLLDVGQKIEHGSDINGGPRENTLSDCDPNAVGSECGPLMIKNRDLYTYYSNIALSGNSHGYIYEIYDNAANKVSFYEIGKDNDSDGHTDNDLFFKTHAFDVDIQSGSPSYNDFLVVYETLGATNNIALVGHYKDSRFLADFPQVGYDWSGVSFQSAQDILIYQNQDAGDTTHGGAIIRYNKTDPNPDAGVSDALAFIDYDLIDSGVLCKQYDEGSIQWTLNNCDTTLIDGTEINIDIAHEINLPNITSLRLNKSKTKAYILSEGNIHFLEISAKTIRSVMGLKDIIPGKTISDFKLTSMTYYHDSISGRDFLILGSELLESNVVVDVTGM